MTKEITVNVRICFRNSIMKDTENLTIHTKTLLFFITPAICHLALVNNKILPKVLQLALAF